MLIRGKNQIFKKNKKKYKIERKNPKHQYDITYNNYLPI